MFFSLLSLLMFLCWKTRASTANRYQCKGVGRTRSCFRIRQSCRSGCMASNVQVLHPEWRNVLLQLCSEMLRAEGLFALQLSRKDAEKMQKRCWWNMWVADQSPAQGWLHLLCSAATVCSSYLQKKTDVESSVLSILLNGRLCSGL